MPLVKQSCLTTTASTPNGSTRKTVFNAKWLFNVIGFDVDEKPLEDYILRRNNFGRIGLYELRKDIATARSNKKLSYCWETVRRENKPRIATRKFS